MKYKVGDTVRVRDWEDMERQYETDSGGAICLPNGWYFTVTRKPFCGKDYKISEVFVESYSLDDAGERQFTDEMLLPAGIREIDLCEIFGVKPDQVFHIKGKNFLFEDEYRVHEKVLQYSVGDSWVQSSRKINEFHDFEVVLYYATDVEKRF